jgi:hypothetical protein
MLTFFVVFFVGALVFLLLNRGKSWKEIFSKESRGRNSIILLLTLLTLVALIDPRVQGRINELRQKLRL